MKVLIPVVIGLLVVGCGPSLSRLQAKAEAGDAEAQFRLGWSYDSGSIYNSSGRTHCPMDPVEAVKWFRKAADQDHAYAQLHLGVLHEAGRGVRQDDMEAAKWWRMAVAGFRKAAKKGDPEKQISLGLMHANGRGAEKSLIAAYAWYNIAELYRGNDAKQLKRHLVAEGMTPDQIAEAGELTKEIIRKNPDMLRPEKSKQLLKQFKAKEEKK